jgi:hypothetical protein
MPEHVLSERLCKSTADKKQILNPVYLGWILLQRSLSIVFSFDHQVIQINSLNELALRKMPTRLYQMPICFAHSVLWCYGGANYKSLYSTLLCPSVAQLGDAYDGDVGAVPTSSWP